MSDSIEFNEINSFVKLRITSDNIEVKNPNLKVKYGLTVGAVQSIIRKNCIEELKECDAIFMFIKSEYFPYRTIIPKQSDLISEVFRYNCKEDTLTISIRSESTFG